MVENENASDGEMLGRMAVNNGDTRMILVHTLALDSQDVVCVCVCVCVREERSGTTSLSTPLSHLIHNSMASSHLHPHVSLRLCTGDEFGGILLVWQAKCAHFTDSCVTSP